MVITAAGKGSRFGSELPKQYLPLGGVPILQRTLAALDACEEVDTLAVVVEPEQIQNCRENVVSDRFSKVVAVVGGGAERALSVREGLRALGEWGTWDLVGVHDGARPLVSCAEVSSAVAALKTDPGLAGAVVAVPSADTVKVVDNECNVTSTPERDTLWRAQTPQIFRWQALFVAYDRPDEVLISSTDDSELVEMTGARVRVVEGSPQNIKITEPGDLVYAESIIAERER